jgi:CRISPR-associated protein Csd1
MFLQRLTEYAERLDLPPTLYGEAVIRYIIELDQEGRPLNPEPTDTADPSSPRTKRGQRYLMPQVQRASGIKPLLLADNAEYTLGLARETSRPERVADCHAAYMDLVRRCAQATGEPAVQAVVRFLENDPVAALRLPDDFDRGGAITFRVENTFVVDLPAVQAFWAAEHDPGADPDDPAPVMQCLICGQRRPALRRLQGKVKRIPGGQSSGTALVSANAVAFESYGLEASLIAPICARCGERFTQGVNDLLNDRQHHLVLGKAAFVFWTRQPIEFSLLDCLDSPQPEEVRKLLETVRRGENLPEVDDIAFYAATLSANGGRAVVRDWLDTTIGEVKRHLADWFRYQAIVGEYGEEPRPLGLYALAAATVRDPSKDLAPPTSRALLRSALTGAPLPADLLYRAVGRTRAERRVTRAHATLIKLVLSSRNALPAYSGSLSGSVSHSREDTMIQLDPHNPHPAYHCGRLLALLEQAQRLAIPGIKATLVDRFYGTASTAPASVFGTLLRGAQSHLAKLERDRPGAYHAIQRRMEEVMASLPGFPRVLTLNEQGLFALGYYHQRAADRAAAREAKIRREAGAPPEAALEAELLPDEASS